MIVRKRGKRLCEGCRHGVTEGGLTESDASWLLLALVSSTLRVVPIGVRTRKSARESLEAREWVVQRGEHEFELARGWEGDQERLTMRGPATETRRGKKIELERVESGECSVE
jgi:hypothetical protein